jgi:hypothetical protein
MLATTTRIVSRECHPSQRKRLCPIRGESTCREHEVDSEHLELGCRRCCGCAHVMYMISWHVHCRARGIPYAHACPRVDIRLTAVAVLVPLVQAPSSVNMATHAAASDAPCRCRHQGLIFKTNAHAAKMYPEVAVHSWSETRNKRCRAAKRGESRRGRAGTGRDRDDTTAKHTQGTRASSRGISVATGTERNGTACAQSQHNQQRDSSAATARTTMFCAWMGSRECKVSSVTLHPDAESQRRYLALHTMLQLARLV